MNSAPPVSKNPPPVFPLRREERPLAAIAVIGLLAAAVIAVASGGYEFLFYICVVAALMFVVTLLHRRIPLSIASLWALLAWAIVHMMGGMIPMPAPAGVLYNFWPIPGLLRFDQLIHAYGFGITAWVVWQCLRSMVRTDPCAWLVLATSALTAMGLGALNEEIEFAATKLVEKTNVGDYDNNAWDLVFNMLGAIIAVGIIRLGCRSSPDAKDRTDT
jgi:hypothetical protein